jgi:FSR family fosmidomycin resistance protein-like MFS transporter
LLAAYIVLPRGQGAVGWFSFAALVAILVLMRVGAWYRTHRVARTRHAHRIMQPNRLSRAQVGGALAVLLALIFSKFFYTASLSSYYTFYMIDHFGVSVRTAQEYLFVYLAAFAFGTLVGGPLGDRIGRKKVIWFSILGALPFTLALPYANEFWTVVLTIPIGLILSSAFSAIVVYAQELMPGKVGMVSGMFFGLAFGMGGIGAAALGELADWTSVGLVYRLCAFLPAIGLVAYFLPNLESSARRRTA